ncbi:MAG: hypothetical protein WC236_05590 [Gallionellaceae bacterium]|jgi:hypothetical protein
MIKLINSSIRNKLLLAVAIALGVSLTSLASISSSFVAFVDVDQARQHAFTSMYAQGLQGGQALRNLVLNPSLDKTGRSNHEKSYQDFDTAYANSIRLAQADPALGAINTEIGLGESTNSVSQANQSVDEISHSIEEQKAAGTDIAQNIERIARMTEENNNAIAETSSAASNLELLASKMQSLVSRFKV